MIYWIKWQTRDAMKNRGGLMAPENFDIIKEERRRNMQKSKFTEGACEWRGSK